MCLSCVCHVTVMCLSCVCHVSVSIPCHICSVKARPGLMFVYLRDVMMASMNTSSKKNFSALWWYHLSKLLANWTDSSARWVCSFRRSLRSVALACSVNTCVIGRRRRKGRGYGETVCVKDYAKTGICKAVYFNNPGGQVSKCICA